MSQYDRALSLLKIRFALMQATQSHQRAAQSTGADIGRLELGGIARREQASAIFGGFRLAEIVTAATLDGEITNGETK